MRRLAPTVVAVSVAVGLTVPLAAPAHAATTLKFARFYADQPGSDTPYTTTRLNREYIQVKNITRATLSLNGYLIHDRKNYHVYRFPKTFRLGAGKTVTVHTGRGTNTSANLYWGLRSMAWNNTGDTAYLMKGSTKITSCTYTPIRAQLAAKTGYKNC
ncbi:lamin tail domain-containing protein [Flexivirga alba]|uniref:Lamin tail domain-containing protein n=1 Tax=Flexivirga alba TaxID=702742 RepID=A0ABW2AMS3_9MICO